MIIDIYDDEIMPSVSAAYQLKEDDGKFILRIALKPHGLVKFHFQRKTDVQAFVNRIVQTVNR